MAPSSPVDPTEVLNGERIHAARNAAHDPNGSATDPALRLDGPERDSIRQTLQQSTRPITGFADRLLDTFDELTDRDRYGTLDLFANLVNNPHERSRNVATNREPRVER